ncbi:heat shock transcription factor, other eukaryote [Chaetoceros tenuissimus]|uniref:Heat shock transcription factor, other eukaryote n=1 Tax=Chaetoceros tenuissimus TaxID=426638 RepID=A0AAD3CII3_9STRA|nr:heat shock transcription factor, other eukaryote [Chaetoceros tenuissimus]
MNAISKFQRNHVSGPFPLKLQTIIKILDEEDESNDLIRWQPHGRAFTINASSNPKEFQEKVMKRFFHNSKVASFFRQINIYDFKRMKKGPDAGCYYHEMFVRGRPDLANAIPRNCVKGDTSDRRRSSNDESEPNFYAMAKDSAGVLSQERYGGGISMMNQHQQEAHGSAPTDSSDISRMMVLSSLLESSMQKVENKNSSHDHPAFLMGGASSSRSMDAPTLSSLLLSRCASPTSIVGGYADIFQNNNERSMGLFSSPYYQGQADMNSYSSSASLPLVMRLLVRQQQQQQQRQQQQQQQQNMKMTINDQVTTSLLNELLTSRAIVNSMPSSTTWL